MHNNQIFFYRVNVEQYVVDVGAVQRQHGMEMMMGQAAPLAAIMGPNEDMAQGMGQHNFLVCSDCALKDMPMLLAACEENNNPPSD